MQAADPAAEAEPAAQAEHVVELVAFVAAPYLPAAHLEQLAAPVAAA